MNVLLNSFWTWSLFTTKFETNLSKMSLKDVRQSVISLFIAAES